VTPSEIQKSLQIHAKISLKQVSFLNGKKKEWKVCLKKKTSAWLESQLNFIKTAITDNVT
jgi:hypothetical protein